MIYKQTTANKLIIINRKKKRKKEEWAAIASLQCTNTKAHLININLSLFIISQQHQHTSCEKLLHKVLLLANTYICSRLSVYAVSMISDFFLFLRLLLHHNNMFIINNNNVILSSSPFTTLHHHVHAPQNNNNN